MRDAEVEVLLSVTALLAPLDEVAQRRVVALLDHNSERLVALTKRCALLEAEHERSLRAFRELERRLAAAGFKPTDHMRQLALVGIRALSRLLAGAMKDSLND